MKVTNANSVVESVGVSSAGADAGIYCPVATVTSSASSVGCWCTWRLRLVSPTHDKL